jgi:hypothetical protein
MTSIDSSSASCRRRTTRTRRPPICPRYHPGEDQSARRRATDGHPKGAAATATATATAATEATTYNSRHKLAAPVVLLRSRTMGCFLFNRGQSSARGHGADLDRVDHFRRTVTDARQSGLWIQKTRKQLIIIRLICLINATVGVFFWMFIRSRWLIIRVVPY